VTTKTKVLPPAKIRWLSKRDLKLIVAMEQRGQTHYDADFEIDVVHHYCWTAKDFEETLAEKNTLGLVAENEQGDVVGFMLYQLLKDRFEVVKILVDPDSRRQGYGTVLLIKLYQKATAKSSKRKIIECNVHEDDRIMQEFLKHLKFSSRLQRKYYASGEDAYQFMYSCD
jgi:ribosomal-protein-alanine N-acetyltransferase